MDKNQRKERTSLDKQIDELNEWQKNVNNPGYFVGTGKIPVPMKVECVENSPL